jgi:hypothetical protein
MDKRLQLKERIISVDAHKGGVGKTHAWRATWSRPSLASQGHRVAWVRTSTRRAQGALWCWVS